MLRVGLTGGIGSGKSTASNFFELFGSFVINADEEAKKILEWFNKNKSLDFSFEEELEAIIGIFCPNTLFPYAREIIANMIAKGGFPEFILQPISLCRNFR